MDTPTGSTDQDEQLVCSSCGTAPPPGREPAARLSWSRGSERGRTTWTCDRCSRANLRSIEGKLDAAWW